MSLQRVTHDTRVIFLAYRWAGLDMRTRRGFTVEVKEFRDERPQITVVFPLQYPLFRALFQVFPISLDVK